MRINAGQHLRMDQRMKLAPRMIQSMEILQLPLAALQERIEQELASNPTLELREAAEDTELAPELPAEEESTASEGERELVVADETVDPSHREDFERLSNLAEEYGEAWEANTYETGDFPSRRGGDEEEDPKLQALANTAARPPSLTDQLLEQWRLADVPENIRAAGEYLIGFIEEDGYLRADRDTLLAQLPPQLKPEDLDQALPILQQHLEPPGLAARDLRECLLLQIDARMRQEDAPDLSVERLLVDQYLKDIEANRLPRIAEKTGLPLERIKAAIANLRQFHPHPGRLLSPESPRAIIPDATVEYDEAEDRYVVRLNHERLPSIQINPRYLKMLRDGRLDRQTRQFISQNLRSGRWLIDAIQQRNHTLQRVLNVVVNAQRDFFDYGPQYLKPLPMTQVADQLGIHVATVSRAVADKYIATPRGILPVRMFFSGGTETQDGQSVSWTAVQAKLKEIIDNEDKSNPLSDDQLVEELKKHGIEIARRTVAKYRKQLRIPTARQRKQF